MNTENYSSQTDTGQEPSNMGNPQQNPGANPEMRAMPRFQGENSQRKSPALASILSLLPGLGQIYVGYYQQGFVFIAVFASTIAVLASSIMRDLTPLFAIFLGFFHIFNVIDANRRANHFNRVMAGLNVEDIPEDFKLPSSGGSTTIGVVLVVIGALFILDLNFDVSMAWVEDWWPAILVAVGINMIVKSRRNSG